MNIQIEKRAGIPRMGSISTPVRINMGEQAFAKYLEVLPPGTRDYYATRPEGKVVDIYLPEDFGDRFNVEEVEDPVQTIRDLHTYSVANRLVTQTYILEKVISAVA